MRIIFSVFCIGLLGSLISCKDEEKKADEKKFFPVLSFLQSQAAAVDTSLYSIVRYDYIDSARVDTSYIPREQFRQVAKEFLSIPDISHKKLSSRFVEKEQFDESTGRVILSYMPIDASKEEIQSQEVLIRPDAAAGDKVTNIIINRLNNSRDSIVRKRLLWQVDRSFQVIIMRQVPGKDETITRYKVSWNETEEPGEVLPE